MAQGGDITLGNGMGGESIYGESFPVGSSFARYATQFLFVLHQHNLSKSFSLQPCSLVTHGWCR